MIIEISSITLDTKLQPRLSVSNSIIAEYRELWESGVQLPPVQVVSDDETFWLVDGFHRVESAKRAGKTEIEANIERGDYRTAMLRAASANATHGLRRTSAEKRLQVQRLLEDSEWVAWSDRTIAEICVVSPPFVKSVRDTLGQAQVEKTYRTRQGGISTMNTAPIAESNKTRDREVIVLEKEEVPTSAQALLMRSMVQMREYLIAAQNEWKSLHEQIQIFPNADGFKGYLAVKNLFDTEVPYITKSLLDAKPMGPCPHCNGEGECLPCGGSRLATQAQLNQVRR